MSPRDLQASHSGPGLHLALTTSASDLGSGSEQSLELLYKPLNSTKSEFRLLVLEPGAKEADIECRLFTARLEETQNYEALSYTWSDTTYDISVYQISDFNEGKPSENAQFSVANPMIKVDRRAMPIRTNLYRALISLRYSEKPRTLWIDAICINQSDEKEKNYQVPQMRRIYEQACHVVCWLGPESHGSERVMECASKISRELDIAQKRGLVSKALDEGNGRDGAYDFRLSCELLIRRQYWFRTWVIQEIFSAQSTSLHCGSKAVDWEALCALYALLDEYSNYEPEGSAEFISRGNRLRALNDARSRKSVLLNGGEQRLDTLLVKHRNAAASDPRDKVYAILEMASDRHRYNIIVDYGIPVGILYTQVIQCYIKIYGDLFLALPRVVRCSSHHLPSWVPDWNIRPIFSSWDDVFPLQIKGDSSYQYSVSAICQAQVRFSPNTELMYSMGWRLDTVHSRFSDPYFPAFFHETAITRKKKKFILFDYSLLRFAKPRRPVEDLAQALVDTYATDHPIIKYTEINKAYTSHFTTKYGFVGLGPCEMEDSDVICILRGCSFPFILRKNGEAYQIFASCYIAGFEYGLFVDFQKNGMLKEEEFKLC